jgi:hypothetical protein
MADGFNRLIHNAIMGKFEADIRSGQLELCRHRCKLSGLLPNLAHELFELGFIDAGGSPIRDAELRPVNEMIALACLHPRGSCYRGTVCMS